LYLCSASPFLGVSPSPANVKNELAEDSEDVRVGQQQARRALRDPRPPPDGPAPRLLSSLASRDEAAALSALADPSLDVYAPLKPKGVCAVHVAASCGSLNVLREILARGVRADYSDHNGMAALHHASSSSSMGPNEALETPGREGLPPPEAAAAGDGRGAGQRPGIGASSSDGRDARAEPAAAAAAQRRLRGSFGGAHEAAQRGSPPALAGVGSPPPAMGTPPGSPAMGGAQQQQIPPPGPAQQMPPGPEQVGLSLSASLEVQQQQQQHPAPPHQESAPPVHNDSAQPAMTAPPHDGRRVQVRPSSASPAPADGPPPPVGTPDAAPAPPPAAGPPRSGSSAASTYSGYARRGDQSNGRGGRSNAAAVLQSSRYAPDGFHSSSNDRDLQVSTGHVAHDIGASIRSGGIVGGNAVAPPPVSGGPLGSGNRVRRGMFDLGDVAAAVPTHAKLTPGGGGTVSIQQPNSQLDGNKKGSWLIAGISSSCGGKQRTGA
ncbi:hypothetical protein THAOC_26318, partial [Thalassiosira oceanica]